MSSTKIGLIGFGCVGQAFAELVQKRADLEIELIAVKDLRKPRFSSQFQFTDQPEILIDHPEIEVIVEASGDDQQAISWQRRCAEQDKVFITANKQFVWQYLNQGEDRQGDVLYEASCTAAIPIIRALETCFPHGIRKIEGILNGSSNFILSQIFHHGLEFPEALKKAQENGFAEADPKLDLDGTDAATKLSILIRHAFHASVIPTQIHRVGIDRLNGAEIHLARQLNAEIKLLASAEWGDNGLQASVRPVLLPKDHHWCTIRNEKNAVQITDVFGEEYLFEGNGAGGRATGTALLNDLLAYQKGYRYRKAIDQKKEAFQPVGTDVWLRTHVMGERPDPLQYRIHEHRFHGPFDLWKIHGLGKNDPLADHPENGVLYC